MGNTADDDLGGTRLQGANGRNPLPQPLDEQPPIRVQHHLDDVVIVEGCGDRLAQRFTEFAFYVAGSVLLSMIALLVGVGSVRLTIR